jgi:hypothetical protein
LSAEYVRVNSYRKVVTMNLTNAQGAGVAIAILGFVFAGAYAVAGHHPERQVSSANPSAQVRQAPVAKPSVPEASSVFGGNADAPEEQPVAF